MKRVLFHLFLFLIPILLIAITADRFLSAALKKSTSYAMGEYSVWNDIFEGKINAHIAVYGSSRAWVHINPTMMGDSLKTTAYNLGIDGLNFRLQYLRHQLYLKYNVKPRFIIYSLDVFMFEKNKELYNNVQFLPYMASYPEIDQTIKDYKGFDWYDYRFPLLRYYGKGDAIKLALRMLVNSKNQPAIRVKDYQPQERVWNDDLDKVKTTMAYYEVKPDQSAIQLFDTFLNECRLNNIKVIFVNTPEYIDGQHFIKNRAAVLNIYRDFAAKYHIPFYDYSNDKISCQKKYFYNSLHLNKTGAELFTQKLIDTLKKTKALNSNQN